MDRIEEAGRVASQVDQVLRDVLGERAAFVIVWARDGAKSVLYASNCDSKTGEMMLAATALQVTLD